MTKKQILKGAIEKALKNGWNPGYSFKGVRWAKDDDGNPVIHWDKEGKQQQVKDIIFDHSFARSFWGEEDGCCGLCCGRNTSVCPPGNHLNLMKLWKHRLQQLVLEKEPLLYLERFL